MSKEAMKLALEALEYIEHNYMSLPAPAEKAITALREALAEQEAQTDWEAVAADQAMTIALLKAEQPAQQKPVAWKLVPTEPTEEMLKAMDNCSKEGYDERLYAGHAASVYMAAVDAAPTPPAQRTWVGLTEPERLACYDLNPARFASAIEAKLKEKNT